MDGSKKIMMDGSSVIMMDSGSGDGQQQRNGQRDSRVIAMGNRMAAAHWMAQWAADDSHQHRSGAMGGDARWTAVAIRIDGGSVIAMDSGSGNGQRRCNGRQDGKAIVMGDGTAVA